MTAVQPFSIMGAKSYIVEELITLIPPCHCFVDVFGGSGVVLLSRPSSSPVEVFNDISSDIVCFMLQLRDQPQEVVRYLSGMPYSRELNNTLARRWNLGWRPVDPVERAAIFHYLTTSSYNGMIGRGFRTSAVDNKAEAFANKVDELLGIAKRLRKVVIENLDFAEVIKRYDRPETFFYNDPPYYGVYDINNDPSLTYYGQIFPIERHIELAELLCSIQGKAMVSYYPHPELDRLYKGWRRVEIPAIKWSKGKEEGVPKERSIELVLMNYESLPLFSWAQRTDGDKLNPVEEL